MMFDFSNDLMYNRHIIIYFGRNRMAIQPRERVNPDNQGPKNLVIEAADVPPEKTTTWKAVIAGGTAVTAALGIGGYGLFGRNSSDVETPRSTLASSHSAPAIPGKAGETTAEPNKEDSEDQTVFAGFTLTPDADPASGAETIRGEEALANALEYSHPPFGAEDQNLINATIATDVFKRLGYILGASGQLALDNNGTPSIERTKERNDMLRDVAADVLFTNSGKNSPFGKAFFGYIHQNTERIEAGRTDTLGYSDLAAVAQVDHGELVRSGNANMPVQTSILQVGLPNGNRYEIQITGRYDENGKYIWKFNSGKQLPGAQ